MKMKNTTLVDKAVDIAKNYKTTYIWGGIGLPITAATIQRAEKAYAKNTTAGYAAAAKKLSGDPKAFYFDCIGLIKAILWGWNGDANKTYGGAKYASNSVPDIGADATIAKCSEVSTKFTGGMVPGEAVWCKGHIGIYIGDGLAVECTPKWDNGVQITAVGNIGKKPGYNTRTWTKHGKLPWVDYSNAVSNATSNTVSNAIETASVTLNVLKRNSKGTQVKAAQALLVNAGFSVGASGCDGSFGPATQAAVKRLQAAKKLVQDGEIGARTWAALLGK